MIFGEFKKLGILGINNRIGKYILRHNKRENYPLVDDKILTSRRALNWGIPMPQNYLEIKNYGDLRNLHQSLSKLDSFVIKPANGSQGNGIIVISKIIKDDPNKLRFIRSSGKEIELAEIKHHCSGILSGLYSLAGQNDQAIIQEKLEMHPVFSDYCYGGIPDIRVIVYLGYPVMSMVRLPTQKSDGRANLHQGAIGAGLNLKDGTTNNAVIENKVVTHHPDTKNEMKNLQIPYWNEILELAARCYDMVDLGYIGVDIVLTPNKGPILLELNARPGLAIQIANLAGLVPRLDKIQKETKPGLSAHERAQYSRLHF